MSGLENDGTSARLALPLLAAGQAQKELSHNEALTMLDLAVQPAVVALGPDQPPDAPAEGECWVVGAAPGGAWSGQAHALAGWTAGGWRFVAAREGMTVWSAADGAYALFSGGIWRVGAIRGASLTLAGAQVVGPRRPPIADATGGTTVDAEARTALAAILSVLRAHGLIAT